MPTLAGKMHQLKKKAIEEGRLMILITAYLWSLFSVLELHRVAVLRAENVPFSYRLGFALINAFILAKVILIAEALHAGKPAAGLPMFAAVLFKSAIFTIILSCFNVAEKVMVGLLHGKTLAQSMPDLAGGGLVGQLLVGIVVFVVLIPFFSFTELRQAMGTDEFDALILRHKTHL
jgi:hypothetical protein